MPAPTKDPEFRRRAVELARLREKPIAQIARNLGIAESGLRRWVAPEGAPLNGGAPSRPESETSYGPSGALTAYAKLSSSLVRFARLLSGIERTTSAAVWVMSSNSHNNLSADSSDPACSTTELTSAQRSSAESIAV